MKEVLEGIKKMATVSGGNNLIKALKGASETAPI
jgi:hypothetical protein